MAEPDVFSWHPDILWAKYLAILAEWREDKDEDGKMKLPVWETQADFRKAIQRISVADGDPDYAKLKWKILLLAGYRASKEFCKFMRRTTSESVSEMLDTMVDQGAFDGRPFV